MFLLTFKTLMRRRMSCLWLIVLICGGTLGMMLLGGLKENQEAALETLYEESQILCTVSNLTGTHTDGLKISQRYIDLCTKKTETQDFSKWIERVMLKRAIVGKDAKEKERELIGFTYIEGIPELKPENGGVITFFEGYTEDIFQSEEQVCVVPAEMLPELLREDGTYELTMTLPAWVEAEEGGLVEGEKIISLKPVGTYMGASEAVYCPFYAMPHMFFYFQSYSDSMSFYVKDNRMLEAFKEEAMEHFSEPRVIVVDSDGNYGIMIYDELFCESEKGVKENLSMLNVIIPTLYILSAGIGFLSSFLFVRGRTKEFAVMRSMGVYRRQVVGLTFSEQLLVSGIGGGIGSLLFIGILRGSSNQMIGGGIFLACYLVGALVATIWTTNVNVMLLLKIEE